MLISGITPEAVSGGSAPVLYIMVYYSMIVFDLYIFTHDHSSDYLG